MKEISCKLDDFGKFNFDIRFDKEKNKWILRISSSEYLYCFRDNMHDAINCTLKIDDINIIKKLNKCLNESLKDESIFLIGSKDYFENYDEYVLSELYNKKGE